MRRKMTRKENHAPMKNVQIIMPQDLHTLVKIKATEEHITLRAYILKTLAASVKEGGEKKK